MPKKKKQKGNPETHKELEGFNIHINEFGEITSNLPIEKLNDFLNDKVDDKKLREQQKDDDEAEKKA